MLFFGPERASARVVCGSTKAGTEGEGMGARDGVGGMRGMRLAMKWKRRSAMAASASLERMLHCSEQQAASGASLCSAGWVFARHEAAGRLSLSCNEDEHCVQRLSVWSLV
mmetsp:Transcript_22750/g.41839  ORF Transcript_22750/g.41839 Transcript_22750/m.41839 type:complete len:111 (+) Transcript_22750:277-609(+)